MPFARLKLVRKYQQYLIQDFALCHVTPPSEVILLHYKALENVATNLFTVDADLRLNGYNGLHIDLD